MPVAVPPSAAEGKVRRLRFSRSDVETMLETGLLEGWRFELIDGELIDKMGQTPLHVSAIRCIQEWLIRLFGSRRVQVQVPLEVAPIDRELNGPEPDFSVLLEFKAELEWRHARGDETLLVVEVANTSIRQNTVIKLDLYARAGVAEYWVANCRDRELIVHRGLRHGRYQQVTTLSENETVSVACLPEEPIRVALLFHSL